MVKKLNAPADISDSIDAVVDQAKKLLRKTLAEVGVPESHGYGHALAVYEHLNKAIASNA